MTHAAKPTYRQLNNQDDKHSIQDKHHHSNVRETVRKFDMLGKSNGLPTTPPPRPPPIQHSVPIKINNKSTQATNESQTSSSDSSHSDHGVNSNSTEQKRTRSNEKPTMKSATRTVLLTKPQISTARIDIRPPAQKKPTARRRRTPPPIPTDTRDYPKRKQNLTDATVYVNSDNELDENPLNDFYETHNENETEGPESHKTLAKPFVVYKELHVPSPTQMNGNIGSKTPNDQRRKDVRSSRNRPKNADIESIGLEIDETVSPVRRQVIIDNGYENRNDVQRAPTIISDYEANDIHEQNEDVFPSASHRAPPPPPPPPPAFALPYLKGQQQLPQHQMFQEESQPYVAKRSLPLSNFAMQLGALIVVFIVCMVLVLAIKDGEANLRTVLQLMYTYLYVASIAWMIWCTLDIIKFRRQWMELTASAQDHEEYMDITERHPHIMFYFPDIHNTGGLFMRVGAGILCMGGLILTLIELARTVVMIGTDGLTRDSFSISYSSTVTITKAISYIFRFLFHCVQFTFLFRYGNIVIDRYHLFARIGLIHLIIANFCTWFEAIVFETLEQLHKHSENLSTTTFSPNMTYSTSTFSWNSSDSTTITSEIIDTSASDINATDILFNFIKAGSASTSEGGIGSNKTTLEILNQIESSMSPYLYPCLIEYSLISLTVFFIMWRNVGKTDKRSFLRFGDRHVFTVNCSRASRGLLIGGIIFLLTILTLIPTYLLDDDAISVTHITELVLLIVALITVFISYIQTTKLFYDRDAHVDIFDQILILITTVGDFAYTTFGLFASLLIKNYVPGHNLSTGVDISIGFIAIIQTFLQSGFILDALKRRTSTKQENRSKPGRETVTALLLMNLAIWLHDSLSAKKVRLNPLQVKYYNGSTWAIIQAFTSPLSIFYRFHSSVCLSDIWQEVYQDHGNNDGTRMGGKQGMQRLVNMNGGHDSQH